MTLLLQQNLGMAWGTGIAATGQSPRPSRYRYGSQVTYHARVWWLIVLLWRL